MTREEALIYLPFDEEDDAQDAYDEKLFELKQFLLGRFPITKLVNGRLAKFEKVEIAFRALGGVITDFIASSSKDSPYFDSIHDLYVWYNREKNSLRLQLSSAGSLEEVRYILDQYIRITRHYATYWKVEVEESEESSIKIGTEPDPMEIQYALNALSDQPKLNSDHIFALPSDNCLKSEAKRLSLWLKFEMNEQSV